MTTESVWPTVWMLTGYRARSAGSTVVPPHSQWSRLSLSEQFWAWVTL